jgi:hypothetical protein
LEKRWECVKEGKEVAAQNKGRNNRVNVGGRKVGRKVWIGR